METKGTSELLDDFAQRGSESAFRALIDRYVNLVFSTALRRVDGDSQLAEDIAQEVFTALARQARTLPRDVMLGGWLHRHTCFVAAKAFRTERRRQAREQIALAMNTPDSESTWKQVAPVLDVAINELGAEDRDAILLRYFENRDFRSVGSALGVSDDAAQKRVSRALDKLRGLLARHGVSLSVATLAGALTDHAVQAAPAGLAARVAGPALAAGGGIAALLGQGWLALKASLALKVGVACGLAIIALLLVNSRTSSDLRQPDADKSAIIASQPAQAAPEVAAPTAAVPAEKPSLQALIPEFQETGHHLQVIVQSAQGQALEGAAVRITIKVERGSVPLTNYDRTFTTTLHGMADVLWPTQKFAKLELLISKDDYASRQMVWDLTAGDEIPPNYTVKLKGGVHVGGFVVDPEGNPVADATVVLSRFWRAGEERLNKGEEPAFPSQSHTTGANGRWTARNLAPELLHRINVGASHSNFIGDQVSMEGKTEIEQELRAGTCKLQLRRGLEARGRVVNEQQQPIAGARVWAGRRFSRERKETKSDAQGRFTFRNVNKGKVDFSVTAGGYASATQSHQVDAAAEEIVFRLSVGSIIRALVQDESGQPLAGVRVALEGSPGEESYDRYEFSSTTDHEGKFEWKSAPASPMPFYMAKLGYELKRRVHLKPGEDNVVTLRRNRQVQGVVLDAETEKPVTRFVIAIGRYSGGDQFYADSGAKEFKSEQGLFNIDIQEEQANGIQATANGYAEQIQTLPPAEDGQVKVVLKLKPSSTLTGIVMTPDGQPVVGASVALVGSMAGGRTVQFARGQLRNPGSRTKLVTTDAVGRFEIPSPGDEGNVVAANGTGYGSATVAEIRASGVLTLQAFGRIEGLLMQGTTASASQELLLTLPNSGIQLDFESSKQTTDGEGRFAFDNVPAGPVSIVRLVRTSPKSWAHSHRTEVVVNPGQTTPVVLGGANATLQGQVRFESAPSATDYTLNAQLTSAGLVIPPDLSPEQRAVFVSSPEWKEQIKNLKSYVAIVGRDGSLLLDSVAPGQYTLRITAQKSNDEFLGAKAVAFGMKTITVPEGADPKTPIQIGEVVLKPAK